MAKKKRKTGKMPAGLRRYWNSKQKKRKSSSKKRRSSPVAKKRRKSSRSKSRRRSHGGGGGSIFPALGLPSKSEAMSIAGGAVYGYLEAAAANNAEHMLNKIPRPIEQLGYAGGTALAAYLVNRYLFKNHFLKAFANGTATVALYKMGKAGKMFEGTPTAAIGGYDDVAGEFDEADIAGELDDIGDDDIGDDDDMGELVQGDEALAVL